MAYPYSLWSSTPHDGFPPSPQPLSAPPPLVLDNAGYPSYPFEDPDKTYSPAEFASKFPAQPPQQTQGERTSGTDCEIANAPSTSPQRSEEYLGVGTSSYPAAHENIHPDAPTMTSTSQQLGGVQDTQRLMLRFPRSVVALADGARLQDIQVDTSDLDPLSTHERYNILGDITSDFGEASASGSNHSNMTSTADTSPIRRQAPVSTFDQPETMPKLLTSIDSVDVEAGSTNQSPDSTADVPTNVPNQATGPGVAVAGPVNGTATPSNPATTSTDIETRIIKAALKCSHLVGAYENLAADESTKRRSPMYLDQPPPYLSGEEQDTYRTQYDVFIGALNGIYGVGQGKTGDKASHARQKMKGLWFDSRRRWETAGKPAVEFGISRVLREALLKSTLERFVTRPRDEHESEDESTDHTLTDPEVEGEEGEGVDMAEA